MKVIQFDLLLNKIGTETLAKNQVREDPLPIPLTPLAASLDSQSTCLLRQRMRHEHRQRNIDSSSIAAPCRKDNVF